MARYDYGLRGPADTSDPRVRWRTNMEYDVDFSHPDLRPGPSRVTARYNIEYVRNWGPRYTRNSNSFAGAWEGQIGGAQSYRRPYLTQGGTRTYRGTPRPLRYDYRDFGPDYGGRYPDEI
ncbi:MAG: hypothetical protein GEU90_16040 [Gemmatimonas sp.]|nr:hypothetical protein [Gemmatimonas sp.]